VRKMEMEQKIVGGFGSFYQSHSQTEVPSKPEDELSRYDSVAASPDYSGSMHSELQGASHMVRSIGTADGQRAAMPARAYWSRHPCRSCETAVVRDISCVSGSRSDRHHKPCRRAVEILSSAARAGRGRFRGFANAVAVIRRVMDI